MDAELRARTRLLRLRLHELYGAVGRAGPVDAEVEWRHRDRAGLALRRTVPLRPSADDTWTAVASVPLDRLATLGAGAWDLRLRLRFRDGAARTVSAHALPGPGLLRPWAVPSHRYGLILVRPYATHGGALALRVAAGAQGAGRVLAGRMRRWWP